MIGDKITTKTGVKLVEVRYTGDCRDCACDKTGCEQCGGGTMFAFDPETSNLDLEIIKLNTELVDLFREQIMVLYKRVEMLENISGGRKQNLDAAKIMIKSQQQLICEKDSKIKSLQGTTWKY